jgi:hypothetical protein
MLLHTGLCVLLALAFCAARRQVAQWQASGTAASSAVMVFDHPYAAALLVTLFIATSPFAQVSLTVREVLQILAFLPMILLTRPVVAAPILPGYALGGLFVIDTIRQADADAPPFGQVILVGETLAGWWWLGGGSAPCGERMQDRDSLRAARSLAISSWALSPSGWRLESWLCASGTPVDRRNYAGVSWRWHSTLQCG